MKTLLLTGIILLSLSVHSQSWCDAGANWKYSFFTAFGLEGYTEINYIGDTVISGQSAEKLEKHLYGYNYMSSQNVDFDLGMEYTYEDNGVVYLWYNNNWDTLYNFNATIGESWRMAKQPIMNACDSNSILTVTATGTKTINSISLNYLVVDFSFPFGFSDTIVEKIGFINSYMLPYDGCDGALDVNEGGGFRCYQDDNFTTYQPHYVGACDFVVGVEENTLDGLIRVSPNPTNGSLTIDGLDEVSGLEKLEMVSSTGKLISEVNLADNELDVSELPTGVYFLNIIHEDGVETIRFVKN